MPPATTVDSLDAQRCAFSARRFLAMITYVGMFLSRFTGEHFLDETRPANAFDALFFHTVAMAIVVFERRWRAQRVA